MTIDAKHQAYEARKAQWIKIRDCNEGEDQVKLRGELYLPKLPKMDTKNVTEIVGDQVRVVGEESTGNTAEYDAYVLRTEFYNAVRRTIEGMVGLVMRKPAATELGALEVWSETRVSREGDDLDQFAHKIMTEAVTTHFGGILIDYPEATTDEPISVAQAEELNMIPFWVFYKAERVFSWRHAFINNELTLVRVVLEEDYEVDENDNELPSTVGRGVGHNSHGVAGAGATKVMQQIRELYIDEAGNYTQQIWRKPDDKSDHEPHGEPIIPKKGNGQALDRIPFVMLSPIMGETPMPPMIDITNLNLRHYRLSADLSHGLHFTALPQYYLFGVDASAVPSTIGPTRVWQSDDADTKAGILEFTGSGLASIETQMDKVEKRMASLGARMLMPLDTAVETATSVNIRTLGETSALSNLAHSASAAIRRALRITDEWHNNLPADTSDIAYGLNTDFLPVRMQADMLLALLQAYNQNAISFETLYRQLQAGEIVAVGRDIEDEKSDIEDEGGVFDGSDKIDPLTGLAPGQKPPEEDEDDDDEEDDDED